MGASYKGQTGADYDELMDRVAVATAGDSPERLYRAEEELRPPAELIR